ncbi:MAG: hypothetical protein V4563_17150 [Pseudomonadota bacterium]
MPLKTIDIPVVGPSNNVPQDDPQKTLNFYAEKTGDNWTLKPTPGATLYAQLGVNGGGRGSISLGGRLFGVRGGFFQEIVNGVAVVRGTLASTQNPVGITGALPPDGSGQILIVDGDHGYVFEFVGNVFTELTEGTHGFVGGLSQAVFCGGYAASVKPGTNQWQFSSLYNFLDWPGTNYVGLQNTVGNIVALASTGKSITIFTDSGFEVWTTEGYTGQFAFTQIVSGFGIGCEAPRSVFAFNRYIYWLGGNDAGKGVVYRYTEGGSPQRLTDHSTERQIAAISDPSDAIGYCYQSLGHVFYVLTFPTGNETICYDSDTEQWHDRAWRDAVTNYMYAVPYVSVVIHDGKLIGLDRRNGKFFEISNDVYTDDGSPIRRERTLPVIPDEADWMSYCSTLELFCEVGNAPLPTQTTTIETVYGTALASSPVLHNPSARYIYVGYYLGTDIWVAFAFSSAAARASYLAGLNFDGFLGVVAGNYSDLPSSVTINDGADAPLITFDLATVSTATLPFSFDVIQNIIQPANESQVMLTYSANRGMTYGQEQWQPMGGNSSYSTRVRWTIGGSAFGFVFKLAVVANHFISWRKVRVGME